VAVCSRNRHFADKTRRIEFKNVYYLKIPPNFYELQ
jgi:hypothetical protein